MPLHNIGSITASINAIIITAVIITAINTQHALTQHPHAPACQLLRKLRGRGSSAARPDGSERGNARGEWDAERSAQLQRVIGEEACSRHLRCAWLSHAPVLQCHVSRPVEEFLIAAERLFEAEQTAACLAQLERLVQGLELGKVRDALGASQPHHVLVCLCHLCVKLGVRAFLKKRPDDGLVFFGTSLVFAARVQLPGAWAAAEEGTGEGGGGPRSVGGKGKGAAEGAGEEDREGEGLRGLLRAWALDQLAFSYTLVGEGEAALSALDSCARACEAVVALGGAGTVGAGRAGVVLGGSANTARELQVVTEIHRMHVHLKYGDALESLQLGLDLLQAMRTGDALSGGDRGGASVCGNADSCVCKCICKCIGIGIGIGI